MQHGDHGASIGIPVIPSLYVEAAATTQKSLTQSLTNTIQRTLEGIHRNPVSVAPDSQPRRFPISFWRTTWSVKVLWNTGQVVEHIQNSTAKKIISSMKHEDLTHENRDLIQRI